MIGITSAAFIVTAFVFGLPSIVAVVLNFMNRSKAQGTFLESHFRWQIHSFWFALLWIVVALRGSHDRWHRFPSASSWARDCGSSTASSEDGSAAGTPGDPVKWRRSDTWRDERSDCSTDVHST
ncbi:MAG: hypothetical protein IPK20_09590 [Betaproteobacteria bacterium]|nr:hypothetical protein [Betaproteobacteria bacterium]